MLKPSIISAVERAKEIVFLASRRPIRISPESRSRLYSPYPKALFVSPSTFSIRGSLNYMRGNLVKLADESTSAPSPLKDSSVLPDLNSESTLPILIRATNGKSKEHRADKIKLSVVVEANKVDAFFVRYAEICKAGMQGLKKRDRSGRKNKAKAKKKKEGVGEVEKKP